MNREYFPDIYEAPDRIACKIIFKHKTGWQRTTLAERHWRTFSLNSIFCTEDIYQLRGEQRSKQTMVGNIFPTSYFSSGYATVPK